MGPGSEWAAKLACAMAVLVFEVMTVRWVALELRRVRPGWPALPLAIALVLLVVVPGGPAAAAAGLR